MKRFWTRTLSGQLISVMLLALALSQLVSVCVYRGERAETLRTVLREEYVGRMASAVRLMQATPVAQRGETFRTVGTPLARYWLSDASYPESEYWLRTARTHLLEQSPSSDPSPSLFRDDSTLDHLPGVTWQILPADIRLLRLPVHMLELEAWNGYGFAVQLEDGSWINAVFAKPQSFKRTTPSTLYYAALVVTAVIFSLAAWLLARRITRPLKSLTQAAESLGRGEELALLPEEGPDDIRSTVATFNRMQIRLRRFVEDRTRMLAAIGHDLRTPITSLRLRAEFVTDLETREKLLTTLGEMQTMTEAALAFARSEAAAESTRIVDLSALLQSLCDDLAELGWDVSFKGNGRLPSACRPDSLRRALRNVIENAVRYGKRARVSIESRDDGVQITVTDDGPGIPAAEHERVFAPFVRLESSRNLGTGGVGLGLSIARSILRSHGGDIVIGSGSTGLTMHLRLPRD